MFCEFKFSNYKSYRDETILDMTASPMKEFTESLIVDEHDGQKFLPVSVIYGPNGGGKSNLFHALENVHDSVSYPIYILSSSQDPNKIEQFSFFDGKDVFAFDDIHKNEPSNFELYFRVEDYEYRYCLSMDGIGITEESFYRRKIGGKKPMKLFVRNSSKIDLGTLLVRAKVSTTFNESIPYLAFLKMNYQIEAIDQAADWISSMKCINCNEPYIDLVLENSLTEVSAEIILTFLRAVDIHVDGYRIEGNQDEEKRRIWVQHNVDGKNYELPIEKESAGTRKLMSLATLLLATLASGTLLVMDELDAKLHPKLLRYIVALFTNPEINTQGAQLIFTCQDVSIMRNDVFRRDEIWFAARNEDEASELWSLADMHEPNGNPVNKNAAFDKQYLSGRYGADPILEEFLNLAEE